MSEDPPSTLPTRSWFERLTQILSGEPQNREELIEELRSAEAKGVLSADTRLMMEGAIEVADLTVADVMIPRSQMVSISLGTPLPDVLRQVIESGHSRFPVHNGDRDEIVGILLAKDLLHCFTGEAPKGFEPLLRPVAMIPESKRLEVLLKEFRQSRNHMAIVVDEYGGVAGLVTIEDVLEQIVGDIGDEHDADDVAPKLIQPLQDGEFLVSALTPIDTFNEHFGSRFSDEEFDTVGGIVTEAMGHVPDTGEEVDCSGLHFRVTRADARRVLQFRVRPLAPA